MSAVPFTPAGYHTVTPYLIVSDARRAIDFYTSAFGAKEILRIDGTEGRIGHAELLIGDSHIMLADEHETMGRYGPQHYGGTAISLLVYVENIDAVFSRALTAGASSEMEPTDKFYGDRMGGLLDPFGHRWFLATHLRDVSMEELTRAVTEQ